jgi:uncharacterized protein DUF6412
VRRTTGQTGDVRGGSWAVPRALVLSVALGTLLAVLPVDGSPGSVTVIGTALALTFSAGLLLRSPRVAPLASPFPRSPDAPARDECCRRGAFRRQSSPDAPGHVRPRAPQTT